MTRLVLLPVCCAMPRSGRRRSALAASDAWIADLTRHDSIAEMAAAVLREAPVERFALAGLSMGGYVAQEIVRQAPRRVERLALLDTRARPDEPEETQRRHALMELAQREGGFAPVTNRMLPLLVHPARVKDEPLVRTIREMAERVGLAAYLRQQSAIIARPDFRPLLPSIRCPTLVLCGRQDALTPVVFHQEIAAAIPGAELEVIEACGHLSTLERPAEVNAALRAWLGVEGRGVRREEGGRSEGGREEREEGGDREAASASRYAARMSGDVRTVAEGLSEARFVLCQDPAAARLPHSSAPSRPPLLTPHAFPRYHPRLHTSAWKSDNGRHQPPGARARHRERLRGAGRGQQADPAGQGHHLVLHRPARLPYAGQHPGRGGEGDPRGQARLHALGRDRRAARGGCQVPRQLARPRGQPGRRGGGRGRQAVHRLHHPVDHRLRRRATR